MIGCFERLLVPVGGPQRFAIVLMEGGGYAQVPWTFLDDTRFNPLAASSRELLEIAYHHLVCPCAPSLDERHPF
jgi:hypothetical protein